MNLLGARDFEACVVLYVTDAEAAVLVTLSGLTSRLAKHRKPFIGEAGAENHQNRRTVDARNSGKFTVRGDYTNYIRCR